jgi:hypothetical protein
VGIERHPWFPYLTVFASFAELLRGNQSRAVELARAADALDPASVNLDFLNVLGVVYAWTGYEADARRIVAQAEAQLTGDGGAWFRWLTRLILGDVDEALAWFHLAFEQRNPMLVLLPVHPIFAIAREHPIMGARIRAMGIGSASARAHALQ